MFTDELRPLKSYALSYLFGLLSLWFLPFAPQSVSVEVVTSTAGGRVYVAAYDSADGFENQEFVSNASTQLSGQSVRTELDLQLPEAGHYVLAAFQDLNGNGELDRNFFGVPTEPYGFAKVPPSKWRAPAFGEIATRISGADRLTIEVRHWNEY